MDRREYKRKVNFDSHSVAKAETGGVQGVEKFVRDLSVVQQHFSGRSGRCSGTKTYSSTQ